MDTELEIIKYYVDRASKKVKMFLKTDELRKNLDAILSANQITDEKQKTSIETEVMLVILGMQNKNDLEQNILKETGLSAILTKSITQALKQKILPILISETEESKNTTTENHTEADSIYSAGVEMLEENTSDTEHMLEAPNKEDIMTSIENPEMAHKYEPRINMSNMQSDKLSSLVTNKTQEEKIVFNKPVPSQPTPANSTPRYTSRDPYREPIE